HVRHSAPHLLKELKLRLVGVIQGLPRIFHPVKRPIGLSPEDRRNPLHHAHKRGLPLILLTGAALDDAPVRGPSCAATGILARCWIPSLWPQTPNVITASSSQGIANAPQLRSRDPGARSGWFVRGPGRLSACSADAAIPLPRRWRPTWP